MLVSLDNAKYEFELQNISLQYKRFESFVFKIGSEGARDASIRLFEKNNVVICASNAGDEPVNFVDTKRSHEKSNKNAYKRVFYKFLQSTYKHSLDWGILTGIRPTKLFEEMSSYCSDREDVIKNFIDSYLVSSKKARVLEQINIIQTERLRSISQEDYSIYIGIPFCPSKCSYCTFFSNDISKKSGLVAPFLEALEKEIREVLKTDWAKSRNAISLYVGGGTPSSLSKDELRHFFEIISKYTDLSSIREITFEAGRPDTLDQDKLKLIRAYGIDRISINPQTMRSETLKKIGRSHSVEQIVSSFLSAKEIGFTNINMDIILGLEDEALADVRYTLQELLKLDPDSITVHSLALKKSSDLSKAITENERYRQSSEVIRMMGHVYSALDGIYLPYYLYRQKNIMGGQENIGFAKKGKDSLYNMIIIEEYQNILAFGPGAISRFIYPKENRIEKTSNTKNLEFYIKNIDQFIERKKQEMIIYDETD